MSEKKNWKPFQSTWTVNQAREYLSRLLKERRDEVVTLEKALSQINSRPRVTKITVEIGGLALTRTIVGPLIQDRKGRKLSWQTNRINKERR